MPTLTKDDYRKIRANEHYARPAAQWREIIGGLDSHDAAARIFGDLRCYAAQRKVSGSHHYEYRDGFHADVAELAHALQAWAQSVITPAI